ncbi:MAG: hypothetical protein LBS84_11350 [Clostridiales bacterium]|jgi:hypothetical protein|nr:hypothetical protein [Clostridiales bacterium]
MNETAQSADAMTGKANLDAGLSVRRAIKSTSNGLTLSTIFQTPIAAKSNPKA